MRETYTVKYRKESQWFWRKIKNVRDEGLLDQGCWLFLTDDDRNIYIPVTAEVIFDMDRQKVQQARMSAEAGITVQRV